MISAKDLIDELKFHDIKRRKSIKLLSDIAFFVFCGAIILINLYYFGSQNKIIILSVSILGLAVLFIGLMFAHKLYEKGFKIINPFSVLIFIYLLLVINMIFSQRQYYSVEWAFLGFVIATIVFYDFKIDSRFLILPALLLLGYIPFLLIGQFNVLAELVAIYVYYFLVVGVILQLFEYRNNQDLNIDFEQILSKLVKRSGLIEIIIVIIGLMSAMIIVASRFIKIEFWKWTSVYLFFLMLGLYLISYLSKEDKSL